MAPGVEEKPISAAGTVQIECVAGFPLPVWDTPSVIPQSKTSIRRPVKYPEMKSFSYGEPSPLLGNHEIEY